MLTVEAVEAAGFFSFFFFSFLFFIFIIDGNAVVPESWRRSGRLPSSQCLMEVFYPSNDQFTTQVTVL